MQLITQRQYEAILKAIRQMCLRCNGNSKNLAAECKDTSCPIYSYRKVPEQFDLFNGTLKSEFIKEGIEFAREYFREGQRWWDDFITAFRRKHNKEVHPNWVGQLAAKMKKAGFYRTSTSRPSRLKNNNGSVSFLWGRL